ncbi:AAA family ATPase [Chitinophaga horti]|uniref:AAA family ATPase n=1 Tax=Chitinophaga horti TaxID=2920382 RepID=UPI003D81BEA6
MKYPQLADEVTMLKAAHITPVEHGVANLVNRVLTAAQVSELQAQVRKVHIDEKLIQYIAALVHETRLNASLYLGASPRASIAVMNCAKATAAINNRDFVTPDDIVTMLPHVLRHRIMLTPEREMEGISTDEVIAEILKSVEVPR